eukprot:TRINITY_DN6259_c0_g1_i1.p1 TRINITY_DN6259_c0_g1~~TRINITY_DN6259_c0_g1_i1.p1  ORF type:complete len:301 (+),score=47.82 TRINITY_DN6259_c0_g1_i1:1-903(+)
MQSEQIKIDHSAPKELLEPFEYISQNQGKGVRHKLMLAFNEWLKIDETTLDNLSELIAILHNASLMIDDIEDNSRLRRGAPVCHNVFGVPSTINTANYMYFLAMVRVHNTGSPEATKVFLEELLNLHRGQGYDIYWRDNIKCPTEEEYKQMVLDKTGGLFRLALRLMQVFSQDKRDYIPLVNLLGLYFQIRDDYINLKSDDYQKNKSFAEDLSEGKFSFPIIHGIQANLNDTRLINILKRKSEDVDIKRHAIEYMTKVGSFDYTQKVLDDLKVKIHKELKELGENKKLNELIILLETVKV